MDNIEIIKQLQLAKKTLQVQNLYRGVYNSDDRRLQAIDKAINIIKNIGDTSE